LQAGSRSKKTRFNPYMVARNSLGYFTPQCYMTFFMFRFFKFSLPAMSYPLPLLHYQNTDLLLFWPSSLLQLYHLSLFAIPFCVGYFFEIRSSFMSELARPQSSYLCFPHHHP
jgi:hypothetical protein